MVSVSTFQEKVLVEIEVEVTESNKCAHFLILRKLIDNLVQVLIYLSSAARYAKQQVTCNLITLTPFLSIIQYLAICAKL